MSNSSEEPGVGWQRVLRRCAAIGLALVASWSLAACAITGSGGSASNPFEAAAGDAGASTELAIAAGAPLSKSRAKVALLLPLSGPGQLAVIAKAMKQAAELALFAHDNPNFELLVKDDKGTPEGARLAATAAVQEGAELILGPLLSNSVRAIRSAIEPTKLSAIAFSNDRTSAGGGVFLLSFMPEQDVDRIIGFAATRGRRAFAALIPDDTYGQVVEAAFVRAVAGAGGTVVAIERYRDAGKGMQEPTGRLAEALLAQAAVSGPAVDGDIQALFVPGGPETLTSLAPMLSRAKLDMAKVKLLGTGAWNSSNIGREAALIGAWYPAPDPSGWRQFAAHFTRTFGTPPPRLASLSYDAVGIAVALSNGAPGRRFSAANITRAAGFSGADGPVRFLPNGLAQRAMAIHELQQIGANMIDQPVLLDQGSATTAAPIKLN